MHCTRTCKEMGTSSPLSMLRKEKKTVSSSAIGVKKSEFKLYVLNYL